jgi:hypothetical protein
VDTVEFLYCPTGYCCNGRSQPCTGIDTCANNRVGYLCGRCPPGFVESFGSALCVQEDQCVDSLLFWSLFVLSVVGFSMLMMIKAGYWHVRIVTGSKSSAVTEASDAGMVSVCLYYAQVCTTRSALASQSLSLSLSLSLLGCV